MIKNITKAVNQLAAYDPQMQRYCIETLYPALAFLDTSRARLWCSKHLDNYKEIYDHRDQVKPTYYSLFFNNKLIYMGSAYKPARIACHIFTLMNEPRKFGLTFSDINKPSFKVRVLFGSEIIYDNTKLRIKEYQQIRQAKPILQLADGTDRLIPLNERREAMRRAGIC